MTDYHAQSYSVSIRSPHRSKGRPIPQACGGDPLLRFNPLPSPKQGETRKNAPMPDWLPVSIRSPHRSKGRLGYSSKNSSMILVSIRSPHRSKGRHRPALYRSAGKKFQSAPLTEARGDHLRDPDGKKSMRFNPLPSPKQGETRADFK